MNPKTVLNKQIPKGKQEVALPSFSFLFSQYIQYSLKQTKSGEVFDDLDKRISSIGYSVGLRVLELYTYRDKNSKRETKLLNILTFIYSVAWKNLFGRAADSLEKSTSGDEYYIYDSNPITLKFITNTKDWRCNAGSYIAGIVEGILDGADFVNKLLDSFFN